MSVGTFVPGAALPDVQLRSAALLITELYPPAIGGTAELFRNVYERLPERVVVLADGEPSETRQGNLTVIRERMRARHWGILRPAGLRHHLARAGRIRRLSDSPSTVLHCARALPEGLEALLATAPRRGRYICWAHGEELGYAAASRELRLLMRTVYRRSAAVIANSLHTARLLRAFGVEARRIRVVHPGVDAGVFRPDAAGAAAVRDQLGVRPGQPLLLTVGRLQRRKGHALVLRALPGLLRDGCGLMYAVVGDGEERRNLEALAARLGIAAHLRFVGAVPRGHLPAYYAASDVFVHPNLVDGHDFEGFGIVFLEAAAAGLPAIGGNNGGVPEAVLDRMTGLLVSATDVDELGDAIRALIADPLRRRQMGQSARQRVLREFSWERAAHQVDAIHAEAAAS